MRCTLSIMIFGLFLGLTQVAAAADCMPEEARICEIRKQATCGPVFIEHWTDDDGVARCDSATMQLTPAEVIPHLRRVRCILVGDSSEVRFTAINYVPVKGPKLGEVIKIENGTAEFILQGHYESYKRNAKVTFVNLGPGATVVLRCTGFGPA